MTESPGGATVRSVRVRMELDIASYMAKAQTVGRGTESMAQRIDRSFARTNRNLVAMEKGLDGVTISEKRVESASRVMNARLADTDRTLTRTERSLDRNSKALDTFSGRTGLILKLVGALGPGLVPLGAALVPVVSGLTAMGGAAAAGIGATVLALNGVGDALKALDTYQLEKTPENLAKVRQEFARIGPDGEAFVRFLDSIEPELRDLQLLARAGVLPGFEEGITNLLDMLPRLRGLLSSVSLTIGDLSADAGRSLAGEDFEAFFEYLRTDAAPTLDAMSRTVGNFTLAFANLLVGLAPATRDFTGGLLEFSQGLADASANLEDNEGFQEFLDYVRTSGPAALEFLGSLGSALASIVEAAAPVGTVVLTTLTALARVLEAVADSPAGPTIMATVTALSVLSIGMKTFGAIGERSWVQAVRGADTFRAKVAAARSPLTKGTLALAGLGIAASGVADDFMLSNTATLALTGSLAGPWGAAVGGAVGLMLDLTSSNSDFQVTTQGLVESLDEQTGAITANTTAWAANELEKNGVLQAGAELGLDLGDITQAALGNADAIARVNDQLATMRSGFFDSSGALNTSTNDLLDFDDSAGLVEGAIAVMGGEVDSAQGKFHRLSDATGSTATEMEKTATAADRVTDAMNRMNGVLDRREAIRNYRDAIDDFYKMLKEGESTPRELGAALDNIARQSIRVAEGLKGTDKVKALTQARKDFVDAATKLYDNERLAKRLANKLFDLDAIRAEPTIDADPGPADRAMSGVERGLKHVENVKTEPTISADASRALAAIRQVMSWLTDIPDEHVKVYIDRVGTMGGRDPMAAGGTVRGRRSPYGDKVLAYLAPGEEVISNRHGQADRARPLLKRINAGRFADGGTAERSIYTSRRGGATPMPEGWIASLADAGDKVTGSLKKLEARLEKMGNAYDREKSKLDSLTSARQSTADAVASSLINDPFGNGLAGFDAQVAADTGDIRAMSAALATLVKNGLDPKSALYQQLAASADVNTAQQLAALSKGQLADRARRFEVRASEAAALGGTVAGQAYNDAIRKQTKATERLERQMNHLEDAIRDLKDLPDKTAHAVGWATEKGTERGSEKGARAGVRDRDGAMSSQVRTQPRPVTGGRR